MKRVVQWGSGLGALLGSLLLWCTWAGLQPVPVSLTPESLVLRKMQVHDRQGIPLSITYQNPWNIHDIVPLHTVPAFLQQAFIAAEDQRFYQHRGVDWYARLQAVWQNLAARRVVRGASTITEQVVRLLHPRPRTLWSRWLEGWEARRLEQRFSKAAILEFYLNQVPYARQCRGVVQTARRYFNRDLSTLSQTEMLALAVLVRAPGRLDLARGTTRVRAPLARLARRLYVRQQLSASVYQEVLTAPLVLMAPALPVQASHFLRYVQRLDTGREPAAHLWTTLDATLQQRAEALLQSRIRDLRPRHVSAGALLVVDHQTNHILAWVNSGGSQIDAILTARQPGSTLKPFLYALALERGWTAATRIDDSALAEGVGAGLHAYRNYSGQHYGPLRLRLALGNSLNIPAIRTIGFVGTNAFWQRLHALGFESLSQPADYYGHGLALGNGEVTLFELVQAYATLARGGLWQPLQAVLQPSGPSAAARRVYSPEVSALIGHILADPQARRLEFGQGSLMRFPVETAVKTGTSSDYRDAWAVGFSSHYTVGVWMGNLRPQPMDSVTGSLGPMLVLRALLAELHRHTPARPLFMSLHLVPRRVCSATGQPATPDCASIQEWFLPPYVPGASGSAQASERPITVSPPRLVQPTPGLHLAMDPRIPDDLEAFPFVLSSETRALRIDWLVDGNLMASTSPGRLRFLWPLVRGSHTVQARIWASEHTEPVTTPAVAFLVK